MPRTARIAPGGIVFHVLNRANTHTRIFDNSEDYDAFERIMVGCLEHVAMRILAYCVLPDHWHLLVWPREDGDLAAFMQRLTVTHVRRRHAHRRTAGMGHLYQGTYKSFPVQTDDHFLTVARYVERNAVRARLVKRAEEWRWCSLWRRLHGQDEASFLLSPWPMKTPRDWIERVNRAETREELDALRLSLSRGRPFGGPLWQARTAHRLALESTFRPRGRPRKNKAPS